VISLTVAAAVMSATLSSADVPAPPIGQQVRDGNPQQAAIEVAKGDNGSGGRSRQSLLRKMWTMYMLALWRFMP